MSKLSVQASVRLNNGVKIPRVGFGTWKLLPGPTTYKAVKTALRDGYRHIDTARIYLNEHSVGKAVRESTIRRQEIFVTTKLWNTDQGYDKTLRAFDRSLKRLGLEYIDLYLVHWPVKAKRQDSWKALEEIYRSGRARSIGVSNFGIDHLSELIEVCQIVPMVNQVEFHPFLFQTELLAFCKQHKIIVEAYSPLAQAKRMSDPVISTIAKKLDRSNAQVMLRWGLQHGLVVLPKSTHIERIRENLNLFNFELDKNDMNRMDNLSEGLHVSWNPDRVK